MHNRFLEMFIHLSSKNYVRHWRRKILTGKSEMPDLLNTEEDVVNHVAGTMGAIGYVSSEFVSDKVKIISIQK